MVGDIKSSEFFHEFLQCLAILSETFAIFSIVLHFVNTEVIKHIYLYIKLTLRPILNLETHKVTLNIRGLFRTAPKEVTFTRTAQVDFAVNKKNKKPLVSNKYLFYTSIKY